MIWKYYLLKDQMKHFKKKLLFVAMIITTPFVSDLSAQVSDFSEKEKFAYNYSQQGKIKEALSEYQQILDNQPDNKKAKYNMAVLLVKLGKYEKAAKLFEDLLDESPSLKRDCLYNLVIIYGKYLNDQEKAGDYYSQINR